MVETLTAWSPRYVPPHRTHFVFVRETRGGRYSAHFDTHMVASETRTPFRDAARVLLAEFGFSPDDRIIVRLTGGVSGLEHEAVVSTLGELAAKQD
jgi:hypothetical protein